MMIESPVEQVDVLLVDDDEGVHFLVARHLRRSDITLAWCADGHAAREFLRTHAVTLLLLDQRLPDCRGDELLEQLINEDLLGVARVSVSTAHPPAPDVCARIAALGADLLTKTDILSREGVRSLLAAAQSDDRNAVGSINAKLAHERQQ